MPANHKNSGFTILSIENISEYQSVGVWARHDATGLEVYHLQNDEADNLFSFTFRTPPQNSTGITHILEHSALCGSRRFELKDPFLYLLKTSPHTFLNAMTFPDKTLYPASSVVEKDYFNLMDVYGDAVFAPLLRPEVFMQEGIRLELDEKGKPRFSGIVYNEMKGNYASHESIAMEWSLRSLFEGTSYGYDSGGYPPEIRNLDYASFLEYYRAHYHPSNCLVFLYGNIPTDKQLAFLNERFLAGMDAKPREVKPDVPKRWTAPRVVEQSYPAAAGKEGASITMNWLLGSTSDNQHTLEMEMLAEILLGTAGSPLYKRLMECGLGEDLSPVTGVESEIYEMVFSAGLRGCKPGKRAAVEAVIIDELKRLSGEGIGPVHIETAFKKVEFRARELKAGARFGQRLMRRALRGWLYGKPPLATMQFQQDFETLKARYQADRRLFEGLIAKWLIENQHRCTVVVKPDAGLEKRERVLEEKEAAKRFAGMNTQEKVAWQKQLEAFKAFQAQPDLPEHIAAIPVLGIGDVPHSVERIPIAPIDSTVPATATAIFTNKVVYLELAFDLAGLDAADADFLSVFAASLTGVGADGKSYDETALLTAALTGGFSTQVESGSVAGNPSETSGYFVVRAKALESVLPQALTHIAGILVRPDFDNLARLQDILKEYRNEMRSSLIPNAHLYAMTRAGSHFSVSEALDDHWRGLGQLNFLNGLNFDRGMEDIARRLKSLHGRLIAQKRLRLHVTADEQAHAVVLPEVRAFVASLPEGIAPLSNVLPGLSVVPASAEAWLVPAGISYTGLALRGTRWGLPGHVHESVLAHYLRTGPLWESVRMQGGAYGVMASAQGMDALFAFASYRDPNMALTVRAFREGLSLLARNELSAAETESALIGAVGKDIAPLSPDGKSVIAFKRHLYQIDDARRQENREILLATKSADIRAAAQRLLDGWDYQSMCYIGGKAILEASAKEYPALLKHAREIAL